MSLKKTNISLIFAFLAISSLWAQRPMEPKEKTLFILLHGLGDKTTGHCEDGIGYAQGIFLGDENNFYKYLQTDDFLGDVGNTFGRSLTWPQGSPVNLSMELGNRSWSYDESFGACPHANGLKPIFEGAVEHWHRNIASNFENRIINTHPDDSVRTWWNNQAGVLPSLEDMRANDTARILIPSRFVVMAHSMGGLTTREYLHSSSYNGDLDKLITFDTPHKGSYAVESSLEVRANELEAVRSLNHLLIGTGFLLADVDVLGITFLASGILRAKNPLLDGVIKAVGIEHKRFTREDGSVDYLHPDGGVKNLNDKVIVGNGFEYPNFRLLHMDGFITMEDPHEYFPDSEAGRYLLDFFIPRSAQLLATTGAEIILGKDTYLPEVHENNKSFNKILTFTAAIFGYNFSDHGSIAVPWWSSKAQDVSVFGKDNVNVKKHLYTPLNTDFNPLSLVIKTMVIEFHIQVGLTLVSKLPFMGWVKFTKPIIAAGHLVAATPLENLDLTSETAGSHSRTIDSLHLDSMSYTSSYLNGQGETRSKRNLALTEFLYEKPYAQLAFSGKSSNLFGPTGDRIDLGNITENVLKNRLQYNSYGWDQLVGLKVEDFSRSTQDVDGNSVPLKDVNRFATPEINVSQFVDSLEFVVDDLRPEKMKVIELTFNHRNRLAFDLQSNGEYKRCTYVNEIEDCVTVSESPINNQGLFNLKLSSIPAFSDLNVLQESGSNVISMRLVNHANYIRTQQLFFRLFASSPILRAQWPRAWSTISSKSPDLSIHAHSNADLLSINPSEGHFTAFPFGTNLSDCETISCAQGSMQFTVDPTESQGGTFTKTSSSDLFTSEGWFWLKTDAETQDQNGVKVTSFSRFIPLRVDLTKPVLQSALPRLPFNPAKKKSELSFVIHGEEGIRFVLAEILNTSGDVVYSFLPQELRVNPVVNYLWDGKDASGTELPDGDYTLNVKVLDMALPDLTTYEDVSSIHTELALQNKGSLTSAFRTAWSKLEVTGAFKEGLNGSIENWGFRIDRTVPQIDIQSIASKLKLGETTEDWGEDATALLADQRISSKELLLVTYNIWDENSRASGDSIWVQWTLEQSGVENPQTFQYNQRIEVAGRDALSATLAEMLESTHAGELPDGEYSFSLTLIDDAGNSSGVLNNPTWTFEVDRSPVIVQNLFTNSKTYQSIESGNITMSWDMSADVNEVVKCEEKVTYPDQSESEWVAVTGTSHSIPVADKDGRWILQLRCVDQAGNVSKDSYEVFVDQLDPRIISPAQGVLEAGMVGIYGEAPNPNIGDLTQAGIYQLDWKSCGTTEWKTTGLGVPESRRGVPAVPSLSRIPQSQGSLGWWDIQEQRGCHTLRLRTAACETCAMHTAEQEVYIIDGVSQGYTISLQGDWSSLTPTGADQNRPFHLQVNSEQDEVMSIEAKLYGIDADGNVLFEESPSSDLTTSLLKGTPSAFSKDGMYIWQDDTGLWHLRKVNETTKVNMILQYFSEETNVIGLRKNTETVLCYQSQSSSNSSCSDHKMDVSQDIVNQGGARFNRVLIATLEDANGEWTWRVPGPSTFTLKDKEYVLDESKQTLDFVGHEKVYLGASSVVGTRPMVLGEESYFAPLVIQELVSDFTVVWNGKLQNGLQPRPGTAKVIAEVSHKQADGSYQLRRTEQSFIIAEADFNMELKLKNGSVLSRSLTDAATVGSLSFELNLYGRDAIIKAGICDANGDQVRSFVANELIRYGTSQIFTWLGEDNQNHLLVEGDYSFCVEAEVDGQIQKDSKSIQVVLQDWINVDGLYSALDMNLVVEGSSTLASGTEFITPKSDYIIVGEVEAKVAPIQTVDYKVQYSGDQDIIAYPKEGFNINLTRTMDSAQVVVWAKVPRSSWYKRFPSGCWADIKVTGDSDVLYKKLNAGYNPKNSNVLDIDFGDVLYSGNSPHDNFWGYPPSPDCGDDSGNRGVEINAIELKVGLLSEMGSAEPSASNWASANARWSKNVTIGNATSGSYAGTSTFPSYSWSRRMSSHKDIRFTFSLTSDFWNSLTSQFEFTSSNTSTFTFNNSDLQKASDRYITPLESRSFILKRSADMQIDGNFVNNIESNIKVKFNDGESSVYDTPYRLDIKVEKCKSGWVDCETSNRMTPISKLSTVGYFDFTQPNLQNSVEWEIDGWNTSIVVYLYRTVFTVSLAEVKLSHIKQNAPKLRVPFPAQDLAFVSENKVSGATLVGSNTAPVFCADASSLQIPDCLMVYAAASGISYAGVNGPLYPDVNSSGVIVETAPNSMTGIVLSTGEYTTETQSITLDQFSDLDNRFVALEDQYLQMSNDSLASLQGPNGEFDLSNLANAKAKVVLINAPTGLDTVRTSNGFFFKGMEATEWNPALDPHLMARDLDLDGKHSDESSLCDPSSNVLCDLDLDGILNEDINGVVYHRVRDESDVDAQHLPQKGKGTAPLYFVDLYASDLSEANRGNSESSLFQWNSGSWNGNEQFSSVKLKNVKVLSLDGSEHNELEIVGSQNGQGLTLDLGRDYQTANVAVQRKENEDWSKISEVVVLRGRLPVKNAVYSISYLDRDGVIQSLINNKTYSHDPSIIASSVEPTLAFLDAKSLQGSTSLFLKWTDLATSKNYFKQLDVQIGSLVTPSTDRTVVRSLLGDAEVQFAANSFTEEEQFVTVRVTNASEAQLQQDNKLEVVGPVIEVLPSYDFSHLPADEMPQVKLTLRPQDLSLVGGECRNPANIKIYKPKGDNLVPLSNQSLLFYDVNGSILTTIPTNCDGWAYMVVSGNTNSFSYFVALDAEVTVQGSYEMTVTPETSASRIREVLVTGLSEFALYVDNDTLLEDEEDLTPAVSLPYEVISSESELVKVRVTLPEQANSTLFLVPTSDGNRINGITHKTELTLLAEVFTFSYTGAANIVVGSENGEGSFSYSSNHQGTLEMMIQQNGITVATIEEAILTGEGSLPWDGRNASGQPLSSGMYQSFFSATDIGQQNVLVQGPTIQIDDEAPILQATASYSAVGATQTALHLDYSIVEDLLQESKVYLRNAQNFVLKSKFDIETSGRVTFVVENTDIESCLPCEYKLELLTKDVGSNESNLVVTLSIVDLMPQSLFFWNPLDPELASGVEVSPGITGSESEDAVFIQQVLNPWYSKGALAFATGQDRAYSALQEDAFASNEFSVDFWWKRKQSDDLRSMVSWRSQDGKNLQNNEATWEILNRNSSLIVQLAGMNEVEFEKVSEIENRWVHITMKFDGSTLSLYRNGKLFAEKALTGDFEPLASGYLVLGDGEKNASMLGWLYNLRAYGSALSADKISWLFAQEGTNSIDIMLWEAESKISGTNLVKEFDCSLPSRYKVHAPESSEADWLEFEVEISEAGVYSLATQSLLEGNGPYGFEVWIDGASQNNWFLNSTEVGGLSKDQWKDSDRNTIALQWEVGKHLVRLRPMAETSLDWFGVVKGTQDITHLESSTLPTIATPSVRVWAKDLSKDSDVWSQPWIAVENMSSEPLDGYRVRYYFTESATNTPVVDLYPPGDVIPADIVYLNENDAYVSLDFSEENLYRGEKTLNGGGINFGLHLSDWAKWADFNDVSNKGLSKEQEVLTKSIPIFDLDGNLISDWECQEKPNIVAGSQTNIQVYARELVPESYGTTPQFYLQNEGHTLVNIGEVRYYFDAEDLAIHVRVDGPYTGTEQIVEYSPGKHYLSLPYSQTLAPSDVMDPISFELYHTTRTPTWNASKDYSHRDLTSEYQSVKYIAVFDQEGKLLQGIVPEETVAAVHSIRAVGGNGPGFYKILPEAVEPSALPYEDLVAEGEVANDAIVVLYARGKGAYDFDHWEVEAGKENLIVFETAVTENPVRARILGDVTLLAHYQQPLELSLYSASFDIGLRIGDKTNSHAVNAQIVPNSTQNIEAIVPEYYEFVSWDVRNGEIDFVQSGNPAQIRVNSNASIYVNMQLEESANCSDLTPYNKGDAYLIGEKVLTGSIEYECLEADLCSNPGNYFDPGSGLSWYQAWKEIGRCP